MHGVMLHKWHIHGGWKVLEFFVKINDLALFISDLEYSGFDWKV